MVESDDMKSLLFIDGVSVGYCGIHICFWMYTLNCTFGLFNVVIISNLGGWIYIPICLCLVVT